MKQKFLSKWIFAGAALVLGLSACNNKNEDDLAREKGYDTYSTVSLSLPASLRADDDDYNKKDVYKGVDHIKTLSLSTLLMKISPQTNQKPITLQRIICILMEQPAR